MQKDIIKKYKEIALSNTQVLDLVDGLANIILYPDLHKFRSIDEVLNPYGAAFILFESKPKFGHWIALIKRGNEIEFFNPYGGYPDDTLKAIPLDFRIKSNQLLPYLSYLMINSPYNLSYNEHRFQKKACKINTCGRWSAARIYFKYMTLEEFTEMINELKKKLKISSDDLITLLTI